MKLTALTHLVARLDAVQSLAHTSAGYTRLYGLLQAAKPAVLAALGELMSGSTLLVTASPQSAAELMDELCLWTDRPCVLFPALETLPYERVRLDRAVLAEREAAAVGIVTGSVRLVVAPVRALLQPLHADPSVSIQGTVVSVGDRVKIDSLLSSWVDGGYADVAMVEEPGSFARRGGVVDVFPAGADGPVRLELFGNEIESIRRFAPDTQRSLGTVERIHVPPISSADTATRLHALEALMDIDIGSMNAEARTRWMDDLARLEAGASLDDLAVFAPYLVRSPISLLDLLPGSARVIVDNALETYETMQDLWQQALDVQREMEEAGDLPPGLVAALLTPDHIAEILGERTRIEWLAGSPRNGDDLDWSSLFTRARLYGGRMRTMVRDVAERGSGRTVITSFQHERVLELLREDEISARCLDDLSDDVEQGVTLLPVSLSTGWTLPDQQVTVLTDYELFGRARTRAVPRRPRTARTAFFMDYAPGDYVVHVEHGVGRFERITRMNIDGSEREYALVEYAGSDRLYVPSDQLERLTRYVGVGDAAPALNRLGGADWQRARQRAHAAAAEIAAELIDVYAKRQAHPGHAFSPDTPWQSELESSFPYPETLDQLRTVEDVKRDMETPAPMDRLVCADVGYGKTEVAVRAAFKAAMDGRQIAVLVPTTVLAQQHFETFKERFEAFPLRVEVLSRFRTPAEQRDIVRKVSTGEVDVLIGTHRILQKDVSFKNLGLLIIDEEQRFGVRHKERLKQLRETMDVLTLTATPIPRTLHMGLVGLREISVIETPPEGRLPIKTYLQPYEERLMREAILRELDRGGQVYIVHNKVATIEALAEGIRRLVPEARVSVGHGQMDGSQLERVMLDFAHGEADVLLCSTIIENGLDIPNVNTIIVNHAHRLGLTQLYQLRGRVGRSANQAYAYLFYPRDVRLTQEATDRMEAIFEAQDLGAGFSVAMKDLEIRGAGNLLGAQQSGHASAVGFDLFTRMIGDAVERLRGVPIKEQTLVSLDLPLTMYLPQEYVGHEAERLSLYRRLASIASDEELEAVRDEMRDRFGPLPEVVENLLHSVSIKLLAQDARVTSLSLNNEVLVVRTQDGTLYDRVSLYRRYGSEARISTNVLRIPRRVIGAQWLGAIRQILEDTVRLREAIERRQPVGA